MQFVTLCVAHRFCGFRWIEGRLRSPFRPSASYFDGAKVTKSPRSCFRPDFVGFLRPVTDPGVAKRITTRGPGTIIKPGKNNFKTREPFSVARVTDRESISQPSGQRTPACQPALPNFHRWCVRCAMSFSVPAFRSAVCRWRRLPRWHPRRITLRQASLKLR
ncbi:hypothetical protein ALO69_102302, partial [Pseudomonas ficuserectae]